MIFWSLRAEILGKQTSKVYKSQLPLVGIQNEKCIRGVMHIFEEQIL